jgi:hypothetical protein
MGLHIIVMIILGIIIVTTLMHCDVVSLLICSLTCIIMQKRLHLCALLNMDCSVTVLFTVFGTVTARFQSCLGWAVDIQLKSLRINRKGQ